MLAAKKGDWKSAIAMWLLIFLAMILVFNFIYKFYMKSTEFENENACHDALVLIQVLAEKSPIPKQEYVKPWPATCRTQDRIYYDKNPEDAEKRLAELMSWCWYMMGEGVIKPFDKDWFESSRKCYICYTVSFPNLESQVNPQGFSFYLQNAKFSKSGQTYYNYLKYGGNKLVETPLTDPIDNKRTYSIVYISPADSSFLFIAPCFATAYAGLKIGGAAGTVVEPGLGTLVGGVGGAAIGFAGCAAIALPLQYLETSKEDIVYAADITREQGGCEGSFIVGSRKVQTGYNS